MPVFESGLSRILVIVSVFCFSALVIQCNTQTESAQEVQTENEGPTKAMEDVPELADAMGQLQTYLHKYALALEAENHELATFYFHEVRASADGIKENIPGYEGYDIARFMRLFFDPVVEPVEESLANRNWEETRARTIELVDACNTCHSATNHGFVQVTPGFSKNPFNQDFSPRE